MCVLLVLQQIGTWLIFFTIRKITTHTKTVLCGSFEHFILFMDAHLKFICVGKPRLEKERSMIIVLKQSYLFLPYVRYCLRQPKSLSEAVPAA